MMNVLEHSLKQQGMSLLSYPNPMMIPCVEDIPFLETKRKKESH